MTDTSNRTTLGTVAYGLVIIVPAAIVFLLLVKLTEILEKVAAPLGLESSFGAAIALVIAVVLAIVVILLFGWVVGAIMRRVLSFEKFEAALLSQIPGYQLVANVARGVLEGESSYPAALIDLHGSGSEVFGFIIEEHQNGKATVYLPSVPVLTVGNICVVDSGRIRRLQASAMEVADSLSQRGIGSNKLIDSMARKIADS